MELKDIIEMGLKAQEAKLEKAIERFEGQLKEKGNVDTEVKGEVRELSEKFKSLQDSMIDIAQKQTSAQGQVKAKSAAEEFVASEQYKQLVAGNVQRARIEVKNTVTSGSTTVFPDQRPGIIPGSFGPLTLRRAPLDPCDLEHGEQPARSHLDQLRR
jgi:uncharacterized coiled-coil protein SlyX